MCSSTFDAGSKPTPEHGALACDRSANCHRSNSGARRLVDLSTSGSEGEAETSNRAHAPDRMVALGSCEPSHPRFVGVLRCLDRSALQSESQISSGRCAVRTCSTTSGVIRSMWPTPKLVGSADALRAYRTAISQPISTPLARMRPRANPPERIPTEPSTGASNDRSGPDVTEVGASTRAAWFVSACDPHVVRRMDRRLAVSSCLDEVSSHHRFLPTPGGGRTVSSRISSPRVHEASCLLVASDPPRPGRGGRMVGPLSHASKQLAPRCFDPPTLGPGERAVPLVRLTPHELKPLGGIGAGLGDQASVLLRAHARRSRRRSRGRRCAPQQQCGRGNALRRIEVGDEWGVRVRGAALRLGDCRSAASRGDPTQVRERGGPSERCARRRNLWGST